MNLTGIYLSPESAGKPYVSDSGLGAGLSAVLKKCIINIMKELHYEIL